jgi:hypothetical protein
MAAAYSANMAAPDIISTWRESRAAGQEAEIVLAAANCRDPSVQCSHLDLETYRLESFLIFP